MSLKKTLAATTAATILMCGAAQAATLHATQIDVGRADVASAGWDASTQAFNGVREDAANALGAPDSGNSGLGFFSLGLGEVAVFDFGQQFTDNAGVFEVTFGCSGAGPICETGHQESVDVYAFAGDYTAFDGAFGLADILNLGFSYEGSIGNADAQSGMSVSIGGPFDFLALVDTSASIPGGTTGDGFDVDAVSVQPVPLPASALLLLAGLGGLGAMRKRKS